MIIPFKRFLIAPVLVVALTLAACGAQGFARSLRVVLTASAPALTRLVTRGAISESFRLQLVADLNTEAGYVQQMANCFDAAPKGDKAAKLQCVLTLETQTRPLLARNFRTNDKVNMIADDIEAVIQIAIIFYGGGSGRAESAQVVTEDDIKAKIRQLKVSLGQE
jgi:hypothetical protein